MNHHDAERLTAAIIRLAAAQEAANALAGHEALWEELAALGIHPCGDDSCERPVFAGNAFCGRHG